MGEEGFRLRPQCDMQVEEANWGGGAHVQLWPPQVVGNCRKLGAPKVFYIAADMVSPEVPERVVQFALDKLGEARGLESGTLAYVLGAGPNWGEECSSNGCLWAEIYKVLGRG